MPMTPLTCSDISFALGVAETKATQAFQPALTKVAKMLMAERAKTFMALANEIMRLEAEAAELIELQIARGNRVLPHQK